MREIESVLCECVCVCLTYLKVMPEKTVSVAGRYNQKFIQKYFVTPFFLSFASLKAKQKWKN